VSESSEYMDTDFPVSLATYANVPVGSTATESAPLPAVNGEPPIPASVPPPGSIENAATAFWADGGE